LHVSTQATLPDGDIPHSIEAIIKEKNKKGGNLELEVDSPFGEGGRVIEFSDFTLASNTIKKELEERNQLEDKKIYFLDPDPVKDVIGEKIKTTNVRSHIDYYVNGIESGGRIVILTDPDFYTANEDIFNQMKCEQEIEIVRVDEQERSRVPTNFLSLPNGKILMAAGTPITQESLEKRVGSDKIITTKNPVDNLLEKGYGVRCFTNLLTW